MSPKVTRVATVAAGIIVLLGTIVGNAIAQTSVATIQVQGQDSQLELPVHHPGNLIDFVSSLTKVQSIGIWGADDDTQAKLRPVDLAVQAAPAGRQSLIVTGADASDQFTLTAGRLAGQAAPDRQQSVLVNGADHSSAMSLAVIPGLGVIGPEEASTTTPSVTPTPTAPATEITEAASTPTNATAYATESQVQETVSPIAATAATEAASPDPITPVASSTAELPDAAVASGGGLSGWLNDIPPGMAAIAAAIITAIAAIVAAYIGRKQKD